MRKFGVFVGLFLCAACVWGQTESLPIGPGDEVHIRVLESPDLEQRARITDAGEFPLNIGVEVPMAGLTPSQAASAVERALVEAKYVLTPHVSVTVDQYATRNVSVIGQVNKPDSYPILTPRSVLDVISMAGGLTAMADRTITIQRRDTKEQIQYFLSNDPKDALSSTVRVFPGDVVVVPNVNIAYVLGAVGKPGGYPMSPTDAKLSVLQIVSIAGATLPSAVPSHARLIRKLPDGKYVEIDINESAMQKGKQADVQLQANDIVYIPYSYIRNMGSSLSGLVASAATATIYRY
ncbi:MAG TPA: polysaccharide biosynthesis/export family protein [Terracidiphilus sp.]|jgi:polysaccharide export outer membrane protein